MALRTRYFLENNEGDRRIFRNVLSKLSSQLQHISGSINSLNVPGYTDQRLKLLIDLDTSRQLSRTDARLLL